MQEKFTVKDSKKFKWFEKSLDNFVVELCSKILNVPLYTSGFLARSPRNCLKYFSNSKLHGSEHCSSEKEGKMKINIIRGILIILLLGTFYIIFGFSSQNSTKSSSISGKISKDIVNITRKKETEQEKKRIAKLIEPGIRKLAHFSIYTVVGFLLMSLCFTYKTNINKKIIISLIIGVIYACSDELHQTFVAGRSGEARDVLIDTSGVFIGICISYSFYKIYKKYKKQYVK